MYKAIIKYKIEFANSNINNMTEQPLPTFTVEEPKGTVRTVAPINNGLRITTPTGSVFTFVKYRVDPPWQDWVSTHWKLVTPSASGCVSRARNLYMRTSITTFITAAAGWWYLRLRDQNLANDRRYDELKAEKRKGYAEGKAAELNRLTNDGRISEARLRECRDTIIEIENAEMRKRNQKLREALAI